MLSWFVRGKKNPKGGRGSLSSVLPPVILVITHTDTHKNSEGEFPSSKIRNKSVRCLLESCIYLNRLKCMLPIVVL